MMDRQEDGEFDGEAKSDPCGAEATCTASAVPSDDRLRGMMYCEARRIALSALGKTTENQGENQ